MTSHRPRTGATRPRPRSLAAERTTLAWSRSGLSLIGCGIIIIKGLPTRTGVEAHPTVGGVILVLGLVAWGLGRLTTRRRQSRASAARPVMTMRDLAPVAYGTAALGVAGVVLAFFHQG